MNKIENVYDGLQLLPEDTRGWQGNSVVFRNLIDKINPKVIIEVGTWKGQSAINMGKHIRDRGLDSKIYCVDTWLGAIEFWTDLKNTEERNLLLKNGYPQIYYQFLSNVVHNKLQDYIIPFPNTSYAGSKYFKYMNIKADLIYIDASHEEDDVYSDLKNYYQILNQGGIIFGDDFTDYWIGVKNAVNKFSKELGLKYDILENNFWIISK